MSTNNLTISDSQLRQILRNAVMGTFIRKISHLNNNIVTDSWVYLSGFGKLSTPEKVKFLTDMEPAAITCYRNMDVLSCSLKIRKNHAYHGGFVISVFLLQLYEQRLIIQIEELPEATNIRKMISRKPDFLTYPIE